MGSSVLPFYEQNSSSSCQKTLIYLRKKGKVQEMDPPLVTAEMHRGNNSYLVSELQDEISV